MTYRSATSAARSGAVNLRHERLQGVLPPRPPPQAGAVGEVLEVPQLQAHSTLRYAAWRQVVAEFVAHRRGQQPVDLVPRLLGHLLLACALTAYECWLAEPGSELPALVDSAIAALGSPSWR